jgi:hypothetical protein
VLGQRHADPSARIAGYVFAADTGLPVPGATVHLTGQAPPRSAAVDESGRYEFTDVPPGRYMVRAIVAGYVVATHGQQRPTDPPASFAVRAGDARSQVDVWLTPLGALAGQVLDERGAPAAGAQVLAIRAAPPTFPPRQGDRASTVADSDGGFRLPGLASGAYHVSVTPARAAAADGTRTAPAPTYYPGTEFPDQSQPMRIEAGLQAYVTITLRPARLGRVSGSIVDSTGRPAANQVVMLNGRPPIAPTSPSAATFQAVDAAGRFTFPAVAPGDYRLDVRDTAGFEAIARRGGPGLGEVTRAGEFASHMLRVAGEDVDVALRTSPGFTISGRVIVEGGRAFDVRGLRVSALPVTDAIGMMSGTLLTGTAVAGDEGTFQIENMAGRKVIRLAGLPAHLTLKRVTAGSADVVDDGIDVTGPARLEIVLGRPTQITGRVVDQEGTGVPGATVVVFSDEPFRRALPHTRYVTTTAAVGSGAFTAAGLPAGRYRAVALFTPVDGEATGVESLDLLAGYGTPIVLEDGERASLTLQIR